MSISQGFLFVLAYALASIVLYFNLKKANIAGGRKLILMAAGTAAAILAAGTVAMYFLKDVVILQISAKFILMIIIPGLLAVWYRLRPEHFEKNQRLAVWVLIVYLVFVLVCAFVGRG